MDKRIKYSLFAMVIIGIVAIGYVSYHANKPLLETNKVADDFGDQLVGVFPPGWWSGVNPGNVKVTTLNNNKVMRISDTSTNDVTEVMKKFKKTSKGVVKCDVRAREIDSGFFIHLPQRDSDYDPDDDAIIFFKRGGVYIIGESDIITLDSGKKIINERYDKSESIFSYSEDEWIHVEIHFNLENFELILNDTNVGTFDYPVKPPNYFTSIYFWTSIGMSDFCVYVDNVDITLQDTVDPYHPLNYVPISLAIISLLAIAIYLIKKH